VCGPAAFSGRTGCGGKPVAIITLHGALAATTILLVVLAAVAA